MKLRPHHLLCTQSYEGKGYSDEFVENMNAITARLRGETGVEVEIICSTDEICEKCPRMQDTDYCVTNDKVKRLDSKVMEYFEVEEKTYVYKDIIREIGEKITADILDDICGGCEWYPVSKCREVLVGATRSQLEVIDR